MRGGSGEVSSAFAKLPPHVRALAREPVPLVLSKANSRSTIHRPGYMDYIGIKRFDDGGTVVGERRFLGLYTTAAYREVPSNIPVLRRKVDAVVERAGFARGSHDHKSLVEVIDSYPRDELFQISIDELYDTARAILELGERQRVKLFARTDRYERFVSCLVYLPRDRFNTANREKIGALLREAFGAETVDWGLRLTEWVLVRIHYTLHISPGQLPPFDVAELEARIVEATRSWDDELQTVLLEEEGEETGTALFRRYGSAFPAAYREDLHPRSAIADVQRIEALEGEQALDISLYRPLEAAPEVLRCKLYRRGERVSLSDVLPMFESLGLTVSDERPYRISPSDAEAVWIYDFGLLAGGEVDVDTIRDRFHEGFARIWQGDAELDGFNGLIIGASLDWREVTMVRAVARYLRQVGIPFSDGYMERTLLAHTEVARALVALFHARFDPEGDRDRAATCAAEIEAEIDAVDSLDEDRILRGFASVVRAMLRTNYYLDKPYVSFKLDPTQIPLCPLPRPRFEIFMHSPRVEGVHLRGGSVARGGLRWSDRREDFRTEILGLMKAQMVKNALIVPVGAKGGFVVKRAGDEVVACYTTFISSLLDITDTYCGDRRGRAAAGRRAPRRRRPIPGRGCRQGHGDLLRHRQRRRPELRLLARRRVRLRRLGRLRPQGDGDHGALGLGVGAAPLPRARRRRPERGLHRRRHRRHERRRVRQRHAAVRAHPARGRLRPPPHLPGPGPRHGGVARRAPAAVRAAALFVGGLRRRR